MKIGYLINTHAGYLAPLKRLLETITAAGVEPERVLIVSGGNLIHGIPRVQRFLGYSLLEVEHDSWDYTALIELLMFANCGGEFFENTHFFCLQDTMEFGLRTDELLATADPEKWATAAFGGQCNLVLYRKDYLVAMRFFILARRNGSKEQSIEHEGALWKMLTQNLSHRHEGAFPGAHEVTGKGKPYSDVERIREYYPGVDIVKWKANYGQNFNAMVVRP
jgi:hypothetical protein